MILQINSFIDEYIFCKHYNVDPTNEYLNVFNLNKFSELLRTAAVLLALVNSKLYFSRGTTS